MDLKKKKKTWTWFYLSVADQIQADMNESLQSILRKGLGLYRLMFVEVQHTSPEKSHSPKDPVNLMKKNEQEYHLVCLNQNSLLPNYTYTSLSLLSRIEIALQN